MKAVVLAAGKGTRLRPLTEDKPKGLVEIDGKPLLSHCFDTLVDLDAEELIVVVGYRKASIIARYGDFYRGVPITYCHQREPDGLASAVLTAQPHVDAPFMVMLGDNVFNANLREVVDRQRSPDVDAAFLVEQVPREEASRYGVCAVDGDRITSVVEKPDDPPSNLVLTGFYTFSPAVFHACHLVRPSDRGEYELTDAIDLLLHTNRQIEAVPLEGWRVDVGYPEDRDRAERLLRDDRE